MTVTLDGSALRVDEVVRVARGLEDVRLADAILEMLDARRGDIERMVASGLPVYGVSTGFGSLATTFIAPDQRAALQRSLIRSHAAGVGEEVETEVVRAMMLCRLRTLCSGVTGVRSSTARAYADLLNSGLTPIVYEFGSLGCSGDHISVILLAGTPRSRASARADMPSGTRNSSRSTSPGVTLGSRSPAVTSEKSTRSSSSRRIMLRAFLTMVVHHFDGMRAVSPDEAKSPLIVDPDAVLTPPSARQSLQPLGRRHPQIVQPNGRIEHPKLPPHYGRDVGGKAFRHRATKDRCGALVPEAFYRRLLCEA